MSGPVIKRADRVPRGGDVFPALGKVEVASQAPGRIELTEALKAYLDQSFSQYSTGESTPETRRAALKVATDAGMAAAIRIGYCLAEIRAAEGQDAFKQAADEAGISKSARYRFLDVLLLFQRLPNLDAIRALGRLEPTAALVCKQWQDDELVSFACGAAVRGITLDQAQEMSTRELMALAKPPEVMALEQDNARLRAQLKAQEQRRDQLARVNAALEVEGEMPAFARAPRHETFALDEAVSFLLDNLMLVYNENLLSDVKHPEVHRYQPVVANNADAVLGKLQGRFAQIRSLIRARFPAAVDAEPERDHQLSPHESAVLADRCERMKFAFRQQAQKRAEDRGNSQVGRRGRTLGS